MSQTQYKLSAKDEKDAWYHYSGNCFSCERCSLFDAVNQDIPGALDKYVAFMRDERGVVVTLVPVHR